MYTISRIHSLIKPAMRGTFQRHVDACEADKYSKKFSCHELLVTMLFATFSNSKSLRILEQRFNAHPTGHYHLRTHAIHRSTLSYALAQKDITPFIAFAQGLMQSTDRKLRRESKTLLYLLDSTTIDLRGRGFDNWTRPNHNSRGIKLHIKMAHGERCPVEASLSHTNVNDLDAGKSMAIEAGQTYVFDKGYCDYNWWHEIDAAGAYFITRLKKNAAFEEVGENAVCEEHILSDRKIRCKHKKSQRQEAEKPLSRQSIASH